MQGSFISETTDCDFKAAVERSKPKSWLKSVSAFANGSGGVLVFGVEDGRHDLVGLEDPQSDADFVSETIKSRIEPVPLFDLDCREERGASLLFVAVRAGASAPYYCSADGRREAYVRLGSQSVVAPPEVLNELILKGSNRTWDALDSGIPVDRASFAVLKAAYAFRTGEEMGGSDLLSFGLATGSRTLTNAGALLADEPLVRCSRLFCTRWGGTQKGEFVDTAEFSGSLLVLLREGLAFVKRHSRESWEKTPDGRVDLRSYSGRAVEEALVNALIHRSYLATGSEVCVDVYDDRLEIVSPGEKPGRPLPDDVVATPVPSERRNPVIADVFHRMHYMERRGTGLRTICSATAAEDAYREEFKPLFEARGGFFRVTLFDMNAEGAPADGAETARNGTQRHAVPVGEGARGPFLHRGEPWLVAQRPVLAPRHVEARDAASAPAPHGPGAGRADRQQPLDFLPGGRKAGRLAAPAGGRELREIPPSVPPSFVQSKESTPGTPFRLRKLLLPSPGGIRLGRSR